MTPPSDRGDRFARREAERAAQVRFEAMLPAALGVLAEAAERGHTGALRLLEGAAEKGHPLALEVLTRIRKSEAATQQTQHADPAQPAHARREPSR